MATLDRSIRDWLQLMRSEFVEIPDLRLTSRQAQRLWGFDELMCDALLDALVAARFLARTADGAYVREGSGA